MSSLDTITPIDRVEGDHAAATVHRHLRALILTGAIPPDTILPQVALAAQLGISRTPLREAIRMLQEEGLVVAEPQKRARVAPFDASSLEALYVQRVSLEGIGVLVTIPLLGGAELATIGALVETMTIDQLTDDLALWKAAHQSFHASLVDRLGPHLVRAVRQNLESSERYRLLAQTRGDGSRYRTAVSEHAVIFAAVSARDARGAAHLVAAHLARTALGLLAELAPEYDPYILRATLSRFSA